MKFCKLAKRHGVEVCRMRSWSFDYHSLPFFCSISHSGKTTCSCSALEALRNAHSMVVWISEFNVQHEVLQVDHMTHCRGTQNGFYGLLITIPFHCFTVFPIPVIQHVHSHPMGFHGKHGRGVTFLMQTSRTQHLSVVVKNTSFDIRHNMSKRGT